MAGVGGKNSPIAKAKSNAKATAAETLYIEL